MFSIPVCISDGIFPEGNLIFKISEFTILKFFFLFSKLNRRLMYTSILDRLNRFQKIKIAIILVYFILNAFLLVFAFQMNIDDLKFLVRMARYIPYFRYIASANMLLIILVITMNYIEMRKLSKRNRIVEQEVINIKSKLYDMEEQKKEMSKNHSQENLS